MTHTLSIPRLVFCRTSCVNEYIYNSVRENFLCVRLYNVYAHSSDAKNCRINTHARTEYFICALAAMLTCNGQSNGRNGRPTGISKTLQQMCACIRAVTRDTHCFAVTSVERDHETFCVVCALLPSVSPSTSFFFYCHKMSNFSASFSLPFPYVVANNKTVILSFNSNY